MISLVIAIVCAVTHLISDLPKWENVSIFYPEATCVTISMANGFSKVL